LQNTPTFCQYCGKPINPDASFCSYCGKRIKPAVQEEVSPDVTDSGKGVPKSVLYFISMAAIIAIIILIAVLANTNKTKQSALAAGVYQTSEATSTDVPEIFPTETEEIFPTDTEEIFPTDTEEIFPTDTEAESSDSSNLANDLAIDYASLDCHENSVGYMEVNGTITNNSPYTVDSVYLVAGVKDDNGNVLTMSSGAPDYATIQPGSSSTFSVWVNTLYGQGSSCFINVRDAEISKYNY
jgi:hypothetical protein